MTSPLPTPAAERIDALDALRGFALGGILLINLTAFASPGGPPGFGGDDAPADRAAVFALLWLVESKFFCLFSLLFGIGFSLQLARAEAGGAGATRRFARRLIALGGFGVAHILLLWEGDILLVYAVTGALLLLFRNRTPRGLVVWAVWLLAVPLAVYAILFVGLLAARLDPNLGAELRAADAELVQTFADARRKASESAADFGSLMRERIASYGETGVLLASRIPTILAMFLIGLAAGRTGLLVASDDRLLRRLRVWGLGVGLTAAALIAVGAFVLPPVSGLLALLFNQAFAGPVLALGYAGAFLLLTRRPGWDRRLAPLAAVGRMALTNYLAQSLICSVLFVRWGFNLGTVVPPLGQLGVAVVIFAVQVLVSLCWLRAFRFGPMEWLWRSITYWRWQPLRRG